MPGLTNLYRFVLTTNILSSLKKYLHDSYPQPGSVHNVINFFFFFLL